MSMKKLISSIISVICFSTAVSCTSYIKVVPTKLISDSENITRTIFFPGGTLDTGFYGDYLFDKVDKKQVFFSNKDISGILGNLHAKPSSQILFTYTPNSIYNHILGFYYADTSLQDIKTDFFIKTPEKELQNGLRYIYRYKEYEVMEVYKQQEKGVIRFISINNSVNQPVDKFRLENNKVFFELNSGWWMEK